MKDLTPFVLSLGAKRIFWFQLIDAGSDAFASYGLLKSNLDKKPSYDAYAAAIKAYRP